MMVLEIQSWSGGAAAKVIPASWGHDEALRRAYGRWELRGESRDDWLDYFDVTPLARRRAKRYTAAGLRKAPFTVFEASAKLSERALADETGRTYRSVLKGVT